MISLLPGLSDMKGVPGVPILLAISFCMLSDAKRWSHSLRNRHLTLAAEEWMPYFGFATEPDTTEEPYKGIMVNVLRLDHYGMIDIQY